MQSLSKFIGEGSYTPYERYIDTCISKVEPLVSNYPKLKKLLRGVAGNYKSINGFLEPLVDFFIEVEKEHKKGLKVTEEFIDLVESIQDYAEYRFDARDVYYLTWVRNDYEAVVKNTFPEIKTMYGYQHVSRLLQIMIDRLWSIYERS